MKWILVAFVLHTSGQWGFAPPLVHDSQVKCEGMVAMLEGLGPGAVFQTDPDTIQAWHVECVAFDTNGPPVPPVKPKPAALEIAI